MLFFIVLIPVILGVLSIVMPSKNIRRGILVAGSICHLAMTIIMGLFRNHTYKTGDWIGLDSQGLLFLIITSILFLMVSIYTAGYLKRDSDRDVEDSVEGFSFRNEPEAIFISCLLFFLATMSLVCISRHMGLLWVAIEATTLVSAPLISFHKHHRSLEATWKYLLICSVGIAVALLGNYFMAFAAHQEISLNLDKLLGNALSLDQKWLKASFLMLLVGYGTKAGIAPMHTWLPDAHSEAPSMVSALLSGALLNCALLGIMRSNSILASAGLGEFSGGLMVFFGIFSIALAAAFMIRQSDYKRMLAYSSIEHIGILTLGAGIGGIAGTGAMLHAMNHSLTKGMLFIISGQILYLYGSKKTQDVHNIIKTTPFTGVFWLCGFMAITGAPPFGTFISEITILYGIIEAGRWGIAAGYLIGLFVIFIAMARIMINMAFGGDLNTRVTDRLKELKGVPIWYTVPVIIMASIILCLGCFIPDAMWSFFSDAARITGGL
jgi:hydrogenase-4 component F